MTINQERSKPMTASNPWAAAFWQLVSAPSQPVPAHFNPRPPGVIRDGSATEEVLLFLRSYPDRHYTAGALMKLTDRSHAAVSWALIYLRQQGLVETCPDDYRRTGWLKYRASPGATHAQISKSRTETSQERLARDETPLPGAGLPGLRAVRRSRNQSLPAVAGELRSVSGGHGPTTESEPLAGSPGCDGALHQGQLPLDGTSTAEGAPCLLPKSAPIGPGNDSSRSRMDARAADQEQRASSLGSRVQPGESTAGQDLQALKVVDAPGRDPAAARVGQAHRPVKQHAVEPNPTRNVDRPSIDTGPASAITPTMKATQL